MMEYLIGVDVGGTYVRIGLYSVRHEIVMKWICSRLRHGNTAEQEVRENICEPIQCLLAENSIEYSQVNGIGLSLAADYDFSTGRVITWPNRRLWDGYPVLNAIKSMFDTVILVENDINCAAIGEYRKESIHSENLIYCGIGTGIGMGFVIQGKVFRGDGGMAGEIGHLKIGDSTLSCSCGKKGCLQAIMKENPDRAAYLLGGILSLTSQVLDIPKVIVGGGVVEYKGGFYQSVRDGFRKGKYGLKNSNKIQKSELYNKNGVLGVIELLKNN